MARFIVTDAAGVERTVTRPVVIDSGGVAREITRGFVIDSGGVARQFWQLATNLTVGNNHPFHGFSTTGYGSVSPSPLLVAGEQVNTIDYNLNTTDFRVQISGNGTGGGGAGDPNFFTSVFVEDTNGITRQFDTATATTFSSFSSLWTWDTATVWSGSDAGLVHPVYFIV